MFIQVRSGLLDHALAGRLSAFDLGVYLILLLQADLRTGLWIGSAPRLLASAPRGASLRDMQRSLNLLASIGFIRVFHRHGVRGNYATLLNKFEPAFGALKGKRLNAEKSESWREPVYESCAVPDVEADAVPDALPDTGTAPFQDKTIQNKKKKTLPAPSAQGVSLALLLRQRILENNAGARITEPQATSWAREADLMMKGDGRAETQIRELIEWSQRDSFWKTNILSMGTLRKQFDRLTLKKSEKGGNRASAAIAPAPGKYDRAKPTTFVS